MELSVVTVPRCDRAATGEVLQAGKGQSNATIRSSDTVSVDNEDSPRVVRFRERRVHGSGCFLLYF